MKVPIIMTSSAIPTPEGTMVVSVTTPEGSGDTERSSLRTVPSVSSVAKRDFGRDIDMFIDEVRTFNHARRLESQDISDSVRALRDEVRGLTDLLRGPPQATPFRRIQQTRRGDHLTDPSRTSRRH